MPALGSLSMALHKFFWNTGLSVRPASGGGVWAATVRPVLKEENAIKEKKMIVSCDLFTLYLVEP